MIVVLTLEVASLMWLKVQRLGLVCVQLELLQFVSLESEFTVFETTYNKGASAPFLPHKH
jgi:hypothetical protein